MKMKLILAISIAMLLSAMLPFAASANTAQTWKFTDTAYTGTKVGNAGGWCDGQCDNVMYKEPTLGDITWVDLYPGEEAYWYAENPAQFDVSFGENAWTAHIWYDITVGGSSILSAAVYSMDSFGTATCLAWGTQAISDPGSPPTTVDITMTDYAGSQDIPSGERLVFQIENLGADTTVTVYWNSSSRLSYIQSPATDPGYPVPELLTIVLLATGLVGLAVYFGLKRRKRVIVKA